jgi:hypothetical protein
MEQVGGNLHFGAKVRQDVHVRVGFDFAVSVAFDPHPQHHRLKLQAVRFLLPESLPARFHSLIECTADLIFPPQFLLPPGLRLLFVACQGRRCS